MSVNWLEIIVTVGYILLGAIALYYKSNSLLQSKVNTLINIAEENITGFKRGGERFVWVVDTLYKWVPVPLRGIISRSVIEDIVQRTFDNVKLFAKRELDKQLEKILENSNTKTDSGEGA